MEHGTFICRVGERYYRHCFDIGIFQFLHHSDSLENPKMAVFIRVDGSLPEVEYLWCEMRFADVAEVLRSNKS